MTDAASATSPYYEERETLDPAERERLLFERLPGQIARAKEKAPTLAQHLADVDPAAVTSREALRKLPVMRKSDLINLQKQHPPFGGLNATPAGDLAHLFMSPGPIYDPESRRPDFWRFARALYAAGFRKGDIVHNALSYHLTPGGSMFDTGCQAVGCAVIPAGVGQTELQLDVIEHLRPTGYTGTPSFLRILLEKARETGKDASSIKKALVSGEALPPSLRATLQEYGVTVYQCYVSADLGMMAYETPALEGMVVDEEVIVEILRPGTDEPVEEGEVGELVVTTMNPDYPLVRFGTGDLSAALPGMSPCGRTNMRIKGWMGRADQTTKIKGMFVHPPQIQQVVKAHPEIKRARLTVTNPGGKDKMELVCEVDNRPEGLADAISDSFRAFCRLRTEVVLAEPGSLPNDGKVIEDLRSYD